MIIRTQQIAVLEAAQWRRFEDDAIAYLHESFSLAVAARYAEEGELRRVLREGVERAKRYGILSETDVTRFLAYEFEFGAGFESLPWTMPVLNAAGLAGDEKMDRLNALYPFQGRR